MPKGIHTNPDCQCCFCKAKRREYVGENNLMYGKLGKDNPNYGSERTQQQKDNMSGENNPMYHNGYLIAGKKNGMHGKKHKQSSKDKTSKATSGENNGMYGKKQTQCSRDKMSANHADITGKNNHMWRGQKYQDDRGYWRIWIDGKRMLQSRYVAEQCLGQELCQEEIVHHMGVHYPIDSFENRGDDSPENLYVFATVGQHSRQHMLKTPPKLISNIINNND